MNGHHFVSYYNCGAHVAAQCRCPEPKQKEVTNTPCPVCVGAQSASARAEDEVAALRKEATEAVKIIDSALPYPTSDLPGGPGPLLFLAQQAHDLLKLSLSELTALRKRVEELEAESLAARNLGQQHLDRAEKAERRAEELDRIVKLTPDHHSCTGCGVILNCNGSHRDHEWECWKRAEKAEARAAKAERERDSYRCDFCRCACDKLQADLDAALVLCVASDWDVKVLGAGYEPEVYKAHAHVLALLEKRREIRG